MKSKSNYKIINKKNKKSLKNKMKKMYGGQMLHPHMINPSQISNQNQSKNQSNQNQNLNQELNEIKRQSEESRKTGHKIFNYIIGIIIAFIVFCIATGCYLRRKFNGLFSNNIDNINLIKEHSEENIKLQNKIMKIEDGSKIKYEMPLRTLSQPQSQPPASLQSETHSAQASDDHTERLLKDLNNFRKTQDLLMKIMNESLYSSRKFIYDKYGSFSHSYNDLYNSIIEGHQNYNPTQTNTQINTKVNNPNTNETMNAIKTLNEIKNKMTMNNLNKIKNINLHNLRTLDRMNMNNKILKLDLTKLTSLREQNMKRNQFLEILLISLMKKQEFLTKHVREQYQKEQNLTAKLQQVMEVNKMLQAKIDEIRDEKKDVSKESQVLNNLGKKFKIIKLGPEMASELKKLHLLNNIPQEVRNNIKPGVIQVLKI